MSNQVTEEMISAFIDGELSPEDKTLVESALSTDEFLRSIYESYKESGSAIKASADFVSTSVGLPADFSSRVMADIRSAQNDEADRSSPVVSQSLESKPTDNAVIQQTSHLWTVRTLVEIVAATVAIVLIVVAWQGNASNDNVAKPDDKTIKTDDKPNNGVHALGNPNGDFKKSNNEKKPNTPTISITASREFSVFVDAKTRPQVDRFWILNDYEVGAPENADPSGDGAKVNVLLIDAKKADALKFFSELKKWDDKFRVFQQSKAGSASWLAPFDISKAEDAEGDFWTLQIVLIDK